MKGWLIGIGIGLLIYGTLVSATLMALDLFFAARGWPAGMMP